MKIETVKLAGYSQWGILVNGMLDCDIPLSNTEKEASILGAEAYPNDEVITSADSRHYSRSDYGYLQHGQGTIGPFRTERVRLKHEYADRWLAFFDGKWRRVHIQVNRTFIVYRGEKITIQIEGL